MNIFIGYVHIAERLERESECDAVPRSNPFAAVYVKESFAQYKTNNRVLRVVEFVS